MSAVVIPFRPRPRSSGAPAPDRPACVVLAFRPRLQWAPLATIFFLKSR